MSGISEILSRKFLDDLSGPMKLLNGEVDVENTFLKKEDLVEALNIIEKRWDMIDRTFFNALAQKANREKLVGNNAAARDLNKILSVLINHYQITNCLEVK